MTNEEIGILIRKFGGAEARMASLVPRSSYRWRYAPRFSEPRSEPRGADLADRDRATDRGPPILSELPAAETALGEGRTPASNTCEVSARYRLIEPGPDCIALAGLALLGGVNCRAA